MLDTRSIYRDKQLNIEDYVGNTINKSKYKKGYQQIEVNCLEQILWIKII